ncbi:ATP-binding protein [Usitatibacter palustris]|nr:ATP-binding protein [Usitatibacter palustris]
MAVVIGSAVFFIAVAPFARVQLDPYPAFIPAYQAAMVVTVLITSALLFAQLRFSRSRALLALACGYLFTATIAFAHTLSFPGLLAPGGLLPGGPQTTAWLYMTWHGAFPLFVLAYARLPGQFTVPRASGKSITATLAAAFVFVALATGGHDALPVIMEGHRYAPLMPFVVGTVWLLAFVALFALWTRPHSVLGLWLMVVMWAWVFDIGLSAILNGGRFDVGFYAGRLYGLVAASLLLVFLIMENGRLYRRLRKKNEALERARAAAVEAERAKGAFLATMSHEIRTPMSGVMGMLELLALTRLDSDQRSTLGVIRDSSQALLHIVDDILDLSKIEAGKLALRPEPTSLVAIVNRVHDIYAGNASAKGLLLARAVDRELRPAHLADPLRLGQVLNNLVSNAIKFTSEGTITIRVEVLERRPTSDLLRISVEDTGIGISSEEAGRLFRPFEQIGRESGGSGLGLSICRRLATLMNGDLAFESAPGSGTRMRLTLELPIAEGATVVHVPKIARARPATPAVARTVAMRLAEDSRGDPRVLVVDDHPVNLLVLTKQLESLGYAVRTARDGLEALGAWNTRRVAAILTDCDMPEMSGYDLARHIRAREQRDGLARLPIIACTANVMQGERDRCIAAGMDDYLPKPIELATLRASLERWLPSAGPVDCTAIRELFGDDTSRAREALMQFSLHAVHDTQMLQLAIDANDLPGVIHAAHRICGASRSIGAQSLAGASAALERAGQSRDWIAIRSAMQPLAGELVRLQAHLASRESA